MAREAPYSLYSSLPGTDLEAILFNVLHAQVESSVRTLPSRLSGHILPYMKVQGAGNTHGPVGLFWEMFFIFHVKIISQCQAQKLPQQEFP